MKLVTVIQQLRCSSSVLPPFLFFASYVELMWSCIIATLYCTYEQMDFRMQDGLEPNRLDLTAIIVHIVHMQSAAHPHLSGC